jgi:hypothetical protein
MCLYFLLLLWWVWVHRSICKRSCSVSNISYLNSPPLLLSFIPPPLFPGTVSTGIIFAFTYMCIHYLYLPRPCHPTHIYAHTFGQNLFCPLVLQVCRRKIIRDNKKNTAFWLVWDKDSYIGRFHVLFPYTYVLQTKLVHLYQKSSLLSSPLLIVVSASLRLLYLFLYSKHINHIQVFGFLPLPYSSHAWSPLSVICVQSYYCICFRTIICIWGRTCDFWSSEPKLEMTFSSSIHLPVNDKISFFFVDDLVIVYDLSYMLLDSVCHCFIEDFYTNIH